jgi:hypothetical protein
MRSAVLIASVLAAAMAGALRVESRHRSRESTDPRVEGGTAALLPKRVLFIGNSLTSANGLPGLVEAVANAAGADVVRTAAVTTNNFSLEDHWNTGPARSTIARWSWDLVILQQGPSALPESQVLLREYVRRFDQDIRRAHARTAVYMVWPSRQRYSDMNGVIASYSNAANAVAAQLLPVGVAWQLGLARDAGLPLYGDDGFHPSTVGSYLAALVIAEGLTEQRSVPRAVIRDPALTGSRLTLLQDIAHQAITRAVRPE